MGWTNFFISHHVFIDEFQKVDCLTTSSTYCSLLRIRISSRRFCVGVDFLKLTDDYILWDEFRPDFDPIRHFPRSQLCGGREIWNLGGMPLSRRMYWLKGFGKSPPPPKSSTYFLLLLFKTVSCRFCGGVDFFQTHSINTLCEISVQPHHGWPLSGLPSGFLCNPEVDHL